MFQLFVESIFNLIITPTLKYIVLSYIRPLWANLTMHLQYVLVLLYTPLVPIDGWIEDIQPPFPALTAKSTRQGPGDDVPVLGPVLLHHLSQ